MSDHAASLDYEPLTLRERIARVYDHITDGRVSKPDTDYRAVLQLADECMQQRIDAALAEASAERPEHDVQVSGLSSGGVYAWCNTCRWTKGWPRLTSIHDITHAHDEDQS